MVILLLLVLLCNISDVFVTDAAGNAVESLRHIGCYNVEEFTTRCSLKDEEQRKSLAKNITNALAKSVKLLQHQQETSRTLINPYTISWVVATGYIKDNGPCSKILNDEDMEINTKELQEIPTGNFAKVMLGLKATCGFDKYKLNKEELSAVLRVKMKAFPNEEFNDFYEYSLAMIALYVNGEQLLDEFGTTLLRGVFIGKNKTIFNKNSRLISDIEAIGLIALSAINKEKFIGHWVRKHASREQIKAKKKIEYILRNVEELNLVTLLHMLQAINITNEPYCKNIINHIISKQTMDGSFDGDDDQLLKTTHAVMTLSGRSILDLRNKQCP